MRNLPREPIPGHDRVAVRVPEHHEAPVYKMGQRNVDDPAHGQFTRDPEGHDVVGWGAYVYQLLLEGALELVGLLLPGPCPRCAALPWTVEHKPVQGFVEVGVKRIGASHHPDCPALQPAVVEPAAPAPAAPAAEAPEPAPEPAPAEPAAPPAPPSTEET